MLFFSPLMTTVELYLKNYIYREVINILEQLNDQIHEALATVVPNMLRLARENLIKRARLKEYPDERWSFSISRPLVQKYFYAKAKCQSTYIFS
jgi:hypothetical protein